MLSTAVPDKHAVRHFHLGESKCEPGLGKCHPSHILRLAPHQLDTKSQSSGQKERFDHDCIESSRNYIEMNEWNSAA